jgi:hypothetical protein
MLRAPRKNSQRTLVGYDRSRRPRRLWPHWRRNPSGARHRPQSRRACPVPGSHRARKYQPLIAAPEQSASLECFRMPRWFYVCKRPNPCYHYLFLYDDANVTIGRCSGIPGISLPRSTPPVAPALLLAPRYEGPVRLYHGTILQTLASTPHRPQQAPEKG